MLNETLEKQSKFSLTLKLIYFHRILQVNPVLLKQIFTYPDINSLTLSVATCLNTIIIKCSDQESGILNFAHIFSYAQLKTLHLWAEI